MPDGNVSVILYDPSDDDFSQALLRCSDLTGFICREHSVIFTLPVIVLDYAQTPDQSCRYTWHNAGLTSGCS
jgi:hypothetical protein